MNLAGRNEPEASHALTDPTVAHTHDAATHGPATSGAQANHAAAIGGSAAAACHSEGASTSGAAGSGDASWPDRSSEGYCEAGLSYRSYRLGYYSMVARSQLPLNLVVRPPGQVGPHNGCLLTIPCTSLHYRLCQHHCATSVADIVAWKELLESFTCKDASSVL